MTRSRQTIPLALLMMSGLSATFAGAENVPQLRIHRRPGSAPGRAVQKAGTAGTLGTPTDGNAAYHYRATLLCADCHATHFSESHGFGGGTVSTAPAPGGDWLPATTPNGSLLKAPTSTELCLACHDGQSFAPDVVDTDSFGVTERSAGFFAGLGTPSFRGHKLDPNPGDLCTRCHFGAGTMATAAVQCIDCHNPHGNGYFRNLWWASDPGSEPPILASIRAGATGAARYEAANVAYPAPGSSDTWREVTNMCIDCHHTFFGPYYTDNGNTMGGFSPYHRHPGTNTEWGGSYPLNRLGANTDVANWVGGSAGFTIARLPFAVPGADSFASATVVAGTNEVFCLTCHKGHGSQNPFSLRWTYGTNSATALSGCQQCHNNVFNE